MEKYLAYAIVTLVIIFMIFIVILSYYSMKRHRQNGIKIGEIRSVEKMMLKDGVELSRTELKEYLQKAGMSDISEEDIEKLLNGETIKIVKKVDEKGTVRTENSEDEEPYRTK